MISAKHEATRQQHNFFFSIRLVPPQVFFLAGKYQDIKRHRTAKTSMTTATPIDLFMNEQH
jgi:hypothetical protein